MATLFEIGNELVKVLDQISDGGEIDAEVESFFSDLQDQEAIKLTNYLNLIATIEMEAAAARAAAAAASNEAKPAAAAVAPPGPADVETDAAAGKMGPSTMSSSSAPTRGSSMSVMRSECW